jgi:hypothetical protein
MIAVDYLKLNFMSHFQYVYLAIMILRAFPRLPRSLSLPVLILIFRKQPESLLNVGALTPTALYTSNSSDINLATMGECFSLSKPKRLMMFLASVPRR